MRYEAARKFALSLAGSTMEPHGDWVSFRVQGKRFASAPPDFEHIHIFVDEHETRARVDQAPAAFEAILHGPRVIGVRVTLKAADAADVLDLLTLSWQRKAPRKLLDASRMQRTGDR